VQQQQPVQQQQQQPVQQQQQPVFADRHHAKAVNQVGT